MKKKGTVKVRRIKSHPKLTSEKLAELRNAAKDEDEYYLSPEGQEELIRIRVFVRASKFS